MKKVILLLVCLICFAVLSGCIRSKAVIKTDPPEAKVTFNSVYRGKTPIEIPFIYYWYYNIEIEKDGYKKIQKLERFHPPIWFYIPFDLIMEALPFPITDTHNLSYVLEKEEK